MKDRNAGAWIAIGAAFVVVAIAMKLLSCGAPKVWQDKGHRGPLPAHGGGYTLIELLCVMAIMGIVLLACMVGWTSLAHGSKFNKAVAEVECAISLGRQWAVAKNEPVIVVFVEPTSYATLNSDQAAPCGAGIAVLAAKSRQWVKPLTVLDGAVFTTETLLPDARNVCGLADGDSWFLIYTNIPSMSSAGPTNRPPVNMPGLAIKTDGSLHLTHGAANDPSCAPKGVSLAPGKCSGNEFAGWTRVITGTRRTSVTVNMIGAVRVDEIAN
jgi:prepilin-type N-terminal cleavage/methylation domain-containing protein